MALKMDWQCKTFADLSPFELYDLLQLRSKVFVVEQDTVYLDCDGKDKQAHHLLLKDESGSVIAFARLLPPGVSYPEAVIGRVVVDPAWRGRGLAHELMRQAIPRCLALYSVSCIRISAQKHLAAFYAQHGFRPVTDDYLEDNIPHVGMLFEQSTTDESTGETKMTVYYFGHSAWLIQTSRRNLLFDYGAQPLRMRDGHLANGVFNIGDLTDLPLYVFASHRHGDHYAAQLHSELTRRSNTAFIQGLDEQPSSSTVKAAPTGTWLAWPHSELQLDDLLIRSSGSTDSGVSFLVEMPEGVIYHGGDLAIWDDTTFFNRVYREEIDYLAKRLSATNKVPDLAFLPVSTSDGYQEEALLKGLWYALERLAPRTVFPMHAHGFESLYQTFADLAAVRGFPNVLAPAKPGDCFEIAL
jgi:ElaA protein